MQDNDNTNDKGAKKTNASSKFEETIVKEMRCQLQNLQIDTSQSQISINGA